MVSALWQCSHKSLSYVRPVDVSALCREDGIDIIAMTPRRDLLDYFGFTLQWTLEPNRAYAARDA